MIDDKNLDILWEIYEKKVRDKRLFKEVQSFELVRNDFLSTFQGYSFRTPNDHRTILISNNSQYTVEQEIFQFSSNRTELILLAKKKTRRYLFYADIRSRYFAKGKIWPLDKNLDNLLLKCAGLI